MSNSFSLDAKIICPYFKRQKEKDKKSIQCCPVFNNQKTTTLSFNSISDKNDHIKNFCMSGFYLGCPIAIAAKENLELNGEI